MPEIIPKAKLFVERETLTVWWTCPGCGIRNILYTFSETLDTVKHEIKSVVDVSCVECCRKYEVD